MIKYVCDRCGKEFSRYEWKLSDKDIWYENYSANVERRQHKDVPPIREGIISPIDCDWEHSYLDLCPVCLSKFSKLAYFFMTRARIQVSDEVTDEVID